MPEHDDFEQRLAARLGALRQARGWSLEQLAERSGVSRAALSRLERGDVSATAVVLGRLCGAYGRTLSSLLAELEGATPQRLPSAQQPLWIDPQSGFRRRSVSPPLPGHRTELVHGELPAGAEIAYPVPPLAGLEHHLWMLSGQLELSVDAVVHDLQPGDCLRYRLSGPSRFRVPGAAPACYLIAITQP
jgi:transcriptional regulator with XRE-family HTH domain